MPFRFPFLPFNFNQYNYPYRRPFNSFPNLSGPFNSSFGQNSNLNQTFNNLINNDQKNPEFSKDSCSFEDSEYFFEIFGLRLHFDDVLIICILFFLYTEEVHDYELFLCLILLLIS